MFLNQVELNGIMVRNVAAIVLPLTQAGAPWDNSKRAIAQNGIEGYRKRLVPFGLPAKPIRADGWLNSPDDTVFPKRGRVTVVVFSHPDVLSFPAVATLRRLHDDFAAQGVDFVFSTFTTGYFHTAILARPNDEMARLHGWFIDFLHLPMAVAVEASQFGRLPDGRRYNAPMTNQANYFYGPDALIVGKDGVIRLAVDLAPNTEPLYRRELAAALAPGEASAGTSAGTSAAP